MSKRKFKKQKHKYVIIVKIGCTQEKCKGQKCLECWFAKWRTSDLRQTAENFLNVKHPTWRYINVFANKGGLKGTQLGSFTKSNPPQTKLI